MKRLSLSLLAASVLWNVAAPAFAQSEAEALPPQDGFVQTPDPEWAAGHATLDIPATGHRAYHAAGEAAHREWHERNADRVGTEGYLADHRELHQNRNLLHRAFHARSAEEVAANTPAVLPESGEVVVEMTPVSHRYEGPKPTRRAIREAAKERAAKN